MAIGLRPRECDQAGLHALATRMNQRALGQLPSIHDLTGGRLIARVHGGPRRDAEDPSKLSINYDTWSVGA